MSRDHTKMRDFSLTNLFFVTGLSFLAFTAGLRFLDGVINPFLLKVGIGALILGVLSFIVSILLKKWEQKNSGMSTDSD